jgi:RNA polymerase sigma-70 factor (ECF subfamily)
VLAAIKPSPESQEALEVLCQAYWYPLYAFVRRQGHSPHDAQDLTQEFFCRLIEKRWLDVVDRAKGKLRTFLVVALKKFLNKEWRQASSQRRKGRHIHLPFDTVLAESRYAADSHSLTPDETFDRQYALTLLDLTLERLRADFTRANKTTEFDVLKNCLTADRGAIDYRAVAQQLGLNEATARVAVHRLRKRFREIYREEIAQTLDSGADLEDEVRFLAAALARH